MRAAMVVVVLCLGACASEKLSQAPVGDVNLSGEWHLNEGDSDDPQRLLQSQLPGGVGGPGSTGGGGSRGRSGRGGGGGPGGGGSSSAGPAYGSPSAPVVSALGEELRWPGKALQIKQVAGVVAFTSDGRNVVYEPSSGDQRRKPPRGKGGPAGRDVPMRSRGEGPPAISGWDDKTLVVQSTDADDDHPPFVQRYSLSEDGQRLIEIVGFKGWRGGGFTLSRVWDRVPADESKLNGP